LHPLILLAALIVLGVVAWWMWIGWVLGRVKDL